VEPGRWQQICDLYAEVLDLNAPDRVALLAERCRGDRDLRMEVESLLAMKSKRGLMDSEIREPARISVGREVLPPGARLGPYEIVAPLGAGGMGTVYRARDGRVGREVAIKISAQQFSERFDREARVIASLNHPNICQLYDVGPDYLVMELVAGESPKGPLPLDEVVRVSRQIAEALEYAHEKGVIHRDLKPANIKMTPEGAVKVLDFGLAKIMERAAAGADIENSPTVTIDATGAGVILGTAAYMAPEQASGKPVDKRADIWSFGAVFYELYTGHRPFRGEGVVDILASILKHEPDWHALPSSTPQHIRELLRWCLEKDRRQRLQSIGDARILLGRTAPPPQRSRPWVAWSVAAVLAAAAIGGWLRAGRDAGEPPSETLTVVPPSRLGLARVGSTLSAPEISPDGSALFYEAGGGLYLRRLDSLEAKLVPGSLAATGGGFWSPDSSTIAYPTRTALMKVRVPDGAPQTIMPLPGPTREGSWSERGTILIAAYPLRAVPASGGAGIPVEFPGWEPGTFQDPEFLPGSDDFLFVFVPDDNGEEAEVGLATLRGGKAVNAVHLVKNPTAARYTPAGGGRLLFIRDDNLYSQKLNRSARKLEGEAELVLRGVASQPGTDVTRGDFSVSGKGVIAWRPGRAALNEVTIFDRSGNRIGTAGSPGPFTSAILSPDDTRILAMGDRDSILDVGQPGSQVLPAGTSWFGWSPDGSKVLGDKRGKELMEFSADGSGTVRDLGPIDLKGQGIVQDVSPDGRQVLSMAQAAQGIYLTRTGELDADRTSKLLVRADEATRNPRFSPDGRWIVYQSRGALVVQPFPGLGRRQLVAPVGADPEWRKDGKEIVYLGPLGIMTVPVERTGSELRFGQPRSLFTNFRAPAGANAGARSLAVSRDGSRIYYVESVEQTDFNMIHIKMGWLK
jgi:serine/threonine protein kinase